MSRSASGAAAGRKPGRVAQGILDNLVKNYEIAAEHEIAICQDTGMACVFVEIGQEVHVAGNSGGGHP